MTLQYGHPILRALPIVDGNLRIGKVEVFDAQPDTFHQPQPSPIEQARHETRRPVELAEHLGDFLLGQHDR